MHIDVSITRVFTATGSADGEHVDRLLARAERAKRESATREGLSGTFYPVIANEYGPSAPRLIVGWRHWLRRRQPSASTQARTVRVSQVEQGFAAALVEAWRSRLSTVMARTMAAQIIDLSARRDGPSAFQSPVPPIPSLAPLSIPLLPRGAVAMPLSSQDLTTAGASCVAVSAVALPLTSQDLTTAGASGVAVARTTRADAMGAAGFDHEPGSQAGADARAHPASEGHGGAGRPARCTQLGAPQVGE
jgi:hypothetical protein